jgi:hypothetical protein
VSDAESAVEGAELGFVCDDQRTEATTAQDGRYEVWLWTPTWCGVSVRDPEGRVDSTGVDLTSAEPGDEVELSVELPDNVVRGTVVDASTGDPIDGAGVALSQVHARRSGAGTRTTTTDGEGRFEFRGVRGATAERTTLEAGAEGYLRTSEEVHVVEGGGALEVRLELRPGEGVTGRVVGPGGEPVAGAVVGCCVVHPGGSLTVQADTGPGGEFTLEAAPGMTVLAAAAGYALGWAQALASEETTVVRLGPRGSPVVLRLLDTDGDPVEGAALVFSASVAGFLPRGLLWLDARLNGAQARTDGSGRLVTAALPPGLYRVWDVGPGGQPRELGAVPVPMSGELTLYLSEE